jgi:hypothetical protein
MAGSFVVGWVDVVIARTAGCCSLNSYVQNTAFLVALGYRELVKISRAGSMMIRCTKGGLPRPLEDYLPRDMAVFPI